MVRLKAIGEYFSALFRGDTVALLITGVFVAFVVLVAVLALHFRAQMRREDEQRRNKWLKKKK